MQCFLFRNRIKKTLRSQAKLKGISEKQWDPEDPVDTLDRKGLPDQSQSGSLLLDFCASNGIPCSSIRMLISVLGTRAP